MPINRMVGWGYITWASLGVAFFGLCLLSLLISSRAGVPSRGGGGGGAIPLPLGSALVAVLRAITPLAP